MNSKNNILRKKRKAMWRKIKRILWEKESCEGQQKYYEKNRVERQQEYNEKRKEMLKKTKIILWEKEESCEIKEKEYYEKENKEFWNKRKRLLWEKEDSCEINEKEYHEKSWEIKQKEHPIMKRRKNRGNVGNKKEKSRETSFTREGRLRKGRLVSGIRKLEAHPIKQNMKKGVKRMKCLK